MPGLTSICLCTWERTQHLIPTLQALLRYCTPPYEVVAVDDASKNPEIVKTLEHYKRLFNEKGVDFRIFVNEKNMRHAASQNRAMAESKGDVLIHGEDDTFIQSEGWNQQFAQFLKEHPEVGLVFPEGSGRGEWIDHGFGREYTWGLGGISAITRQVYMAGGIWDPLLWHQCEVDHCLTVRMLGYRLMEVPGLRMVHLGEGEQQNTFHREAQVIVGVNQFLLKWNSRFQGNVWNYDDLFSMSYDDLPPNQNWRRRLAAWFAAEAQKLEDKWRGLGDLKGDPHYAGAVPDGVRKMHAEFRRCRLNENAPDFTFPGHWGRFQKIVTLRPAGREREAELIQLVKNNHVFQARRCVEAQLRDLAKRMNYALTDVELQKYAGLVPESYSWVGQPVWPK